MCDKHQATEEPCELKSSCTVLKSNGSREGVVDFTRATHDAQKLLQINLRSDKGGKEKRILELDIEKCFDRISHTSIMERLIAPQGIRAGIFRCLLAGVNPEYPEQGTPQGGVVTPFTMLQKIFTRIWS